MWSSIEIAPDVFFIERGWLNANQLVARRPVVALIDTGYKDDIGTTVEALATLGVAVGDVRRIVNTHCHCDHAGGNRFIQEASGCAVLLHRNEQARIERRDDIGTWWRFHDTWADYFRVDGGLAGGDRIDFGRLELEVVDAGGHSQGQLALYCREHRFLVSADALWQGDLGVLNTFVEGDGALDGAMATLEKFLALNAAVVYPGHGPPITSPEQSIRRCVRRLESYRKDPIKIQEDHLRKMAAYVVLTKGKVEEAGFFDYLLRQIWFGALVERCFEGRAREVYEWTVGEMLKLKMIRRDGPFLVGTGKR